MKLVKLYIILTYVVLHAETTAADDCTYSSYNFSPLKNTVWDAWNDTTNVKTSYEISICSPLTNQADGCSQDTSVCQKTDQKQSAVGNYAQKLNITEDGTKGELMLYQQGGDCPNEDNVKWATIIYFKCGKTLGSPALLSSHACTIYFEWYTSVACKVPSSATKEVKCYLYDDTGVKYDLSPLVKLKGGYLTESPAEDSEFYINVCRDIYPEEDTVSCPNGGAACSVGSVVIDGGKPSSNLQMSSKMLMLTYTSDSKPDGCSEKATTTVQFVCPERSERQNGQPHGRLPKLLSELNCQYEVTWVTEYACPEVYTSTDKCSFTISKHDIEVDLRSLEAPGFPYNITVPSPKGEETYIYRLNVCGPLHLVSCSDQGDNTGITACQSKQGEPHFGMSLGLLNTQRLRYSDGELSLTYSGGTPCNHNHFQRQTVINFHCKENAGKDSKPTFSYDDDCTYVFDWETEHACVRREPPATQCSVQSGDKRFDMTSLIKESGDNWEALDNDNVELPNAPKARYFINLCHDVIKSGDAHGCEEGAGVCSYAEDADTDKKYKNLGQFLTPPSTTDAADSVTLNYTEGDPCDSNPSKRYKSIITLRCKPGDQETGPILTGISVEECAYEFVWWTMVGCPLSKTTSTDCKVTDEVAGFSFDLSPLTKPEPYKVSSDDYDYYLNVCAGVTGTECNKGGRSDHKAGVCQVSHDNTQQAYNTGQFNSNLTYYDGMITLTYENGDPYHSQELRKTRITFLCDPEKSGGFPEFQDETDHTYSFRWFTSYACLAQPTECVVFDEENDKQYDLSSLSRTTAEENWSTEDGVQKRKFYINVCRPLTPVLQVGSGCSPFAAICSTGFTDGQETVQIDNLGKAMTRPKLDGEEIVLEYTNGKSCTEASTNNKFYSTKIHLRCKKGALTEPPQFLDQGGDDRCQFSFLWETEAACPVAEKVDGDNCSVKDPNSEYVYNLLPLRKREGFYSVSGTTYKLNVCGAVSECQKLNGKDSAVCDDKVSLGEVGSKLDLFDGILTLTYTGSMVGQVYSKTIITFICDETVSDPKPTFKSQVGSNHLFDFRTPLACAPGPVDCKVSDGKGNEYDLTPLVKEAGNWTVIDADTRAKYYINVCRPLKVDPGSPCPGGPVGSCQVTSDGKAFNAGYIQGRPRAALDNTVTLRYYGGDKCHANTEHEALRSTRINFECSNSEHDPVFEGESADCEYLFSWRTRSACPLKKVVGDNCVVEDPLYHETFNLSPLTKPDGNYEVTSGDGQYKYLLNVCGSLNAGPGECQGEVAACQTKPLDSTYTVSAGKANGQLIYKDGLLQLVYKEGKGSCHKLYDRTTIITFVCDHNTTGKAGPRYIKEDFDCTYMFEWPTTYACMPFKVGQCSVADDQGNSYDLSSLTLTNSNYEDEQSNPHRKFVLNVCSVLVHSKGVTCPPNAAACLIDMTDDKKKSYVSLGEPGARQLTVDNTGSSPRLKLTYTDGSQCKNGKQSKTFIFLTCKKGALDTGPQFQFQEEECEYTFSWETQAACPVQIESPPVSGSDCKAKNPATGYEFNLNSLKKPEGYEVPDLADHIFRINVCEPVKDAGNCGQNSGSCQKDTKGDNMWNAGNANSKLAYIDGTLMLNYTDGEVCHHNNLPRNTVINFVCGDGQPTFVAETDDCSYYISWFTELACEDRVKCEVDHKGQVVDLSPLTKTTGYHLATYSTEDSDDENVAYYINVCRPLNPIQGVLCPPGAAACLKSNQQASVSLGIIDKAPTVDPDSDKITIRYINGSQCGSAGRKRSSTIIFTCEQGLSQGSPRLVSVSKDDCEYVYEWSTNVVCLELPPVVKQNNCTFQDSRTQYTYDFSSLKNANSHYLVRTKDASYFLNICGAVGGDAGQKSGCSGAAVCRVGETDQTALSMGTAAEVSFLMEGETIKMVYLNGGPCTAGTKHKASAAVLFECSREVSGMGEPQYFASGDCNIVFTWKTPLACLPIVETCVFTHKGATYDLSQLSRESSSWQISDSDGASYWLNLCQSVHGGPSGCLKGAAVCVQDKDGNVDVLGQTQTQQMYMDDEKQALVIQYTQGSASACSHGRTRSDRSAASVKIYLRCSKAPYLWNPVKLKSSENDDSCLFEFEWKTHIACKEQRVKVEEKDGLIHDPRTNYPININLMLNVQKEVPDADYVYLLRMNGEIDQSGCRGAAVCQTKPTADEFQSRNIGDYSSRKFFMEDDVLEMELKSSTYCDGSQTEGQQSVIQFSCSETKKEPFLLSQSSDCQYVFSWQTPALCQNLSLAGPAGDGDGGGGGGGRHNTAGIVIGILSAVVVVAVLAIVLRKKERRTALYVKFRTCFNRTRSRASYRYQTLVKEDRNSLLASSTGGYGTDVEDAGGLNPFNDDSDDDIIL